MPKRLVSDFLDGMKLVKIREGQKFVISIGLWVVIIVAVIVVGWQKLPKFGEKQVAGEKISTEIATGSAKPTLTSTPQVTPTAKPTAAPVPTVTPQAAASDVSPQQPNPEPPDLLSYYGDKLANLRSLEPAQQLNLSQGSIKFSFTYDGGDDDMVFFFGNFNGQDRKNVLAIVFAGCGIGFDTYDKDAQEGEDDPNIELVSDCAGKNFDLEFRWNFISQPAVKRIYVGGELKRESFPKTVPTEANSQNLIGPIGDLTISDNF